MGKIIDKCLEPYYIDQDKDCFKVLLPLQKPREKSDRDVMGYFISLERALLYIVGQKTRVACGQVPSVTLKEYIQTYIRIKDEVVLPVMDIIEKLPTTRFSH